MPTIVGPKVKVDGATSQPCYADSCADRAPLSATLPVGAQYVRTHCFTTADYPNDRVDVYETGPGEVSFARFSEAVHSPNENGQEVVTVYYYNRANRARWGFDQCGLSVVHVNGGENHPRTVNEQPGFKTGRVRIAPSGRHLRQRG